MAEGPQRRRQDVNRARVLRTEQLTPHMVRVVLGGELAGFTVGDSTDHYIKLLFPAPGAVYPEPFDIQRIREELPRDQWPRIRTYTVRGWDPDARELSVDFVYHGDEGIAGPWAANVQPGAEVFFLGPGGGYAPDPGADWHLLAGDESALPAVATALERIADGVPVRAFIEVSGPEEEQKLTVPDGARLRWLHRAGRPVGEALVEAVRALEFPAGTPHVFIHGEAHFVKDLRRYLRVELGLERERLSISGYWRTGADEDAWQSTKREWNRQVEEEQESGTSS